MNSGKITSRILFVCMGNICRSPMADGALRREAAAAGLAVESDSAATGPWHLGNPPDDRAIQRAAARGYDIADLRARLVRAEDFQDFDLILAMDRANLSFLKEQKPEGGKAALRLFLDFAEGLEGQEVPDPYHGGLADYDIALDLIEKGIAGLVTALKQARR